MGHDREPVVFMSEQIGAELEVRIGIGHNRKDSGRSVTLCHFGRPAVTVSYSATLNEAPLATCVLLALQGVPCEGCY
jgi:hypothetical protein